MFLSHQPTNNTKTTPKKKEAKQRIIEVILEIENES